MSLEIYPWEEKEFVCDFLAQTFYYVSHSEKLLALAIARLNDSGLAKRFKEHLSEEHNHELLAVNDLKRLKSNLANHKECPQTRTFYECQYYKIEHQNPLALMGYILFLEELAAKEGSYIHDLIKKKHGVSSTFLKVHGEEDLDHVAKARELIFDLPLEVQSIINVNFEQSRKNYYAMLDSICERITSPIAA